MSIDSAVADLERRARGFADEFIAREGLSKPDAMRATVARKYIELAELGASLIPTDVVERILADKVRLGDDGERRVTEAIIRGENPDLAVQRTIAVVDTVHIQDLAEIKGYALRAWQKACDDFVSMKDEAGW